MTTPNREPPRQRKLAPTFVVKKNPATFDPRAEAGSSYSVTRATPGNKRTFGGRDDPVVPDDRAAKRSRIYRAEWKYEVPSAKKRRLVKTKVPLTRSLRVVEFTETLGRHLVLAGLAVAGSPTVKVAEASDETKNDDYVDLVVTWTDPDGGEQRRTVKYLPRFVSKYRDDAEAAADGHRIAKDRDVFWVEIHGAQPYEDGWLEGGVADWIVQEKDGGHVVVDRVLLKSFVDGRIAEKTAFVTDYRDALYKVLRLPGRFLMRSIALISDMEAEPGLVVCRLSPPSAEVSADPAGPTADTESQ